MANGFLSRVSWGETFLFMLIRIIFGSIGLVLLILFTGGFANGSFSSASDGGVVGVIGFIIAVPLFVLMMSGLALVSAWLSQVGVSFTGLFSYICSLPMYVGDPLVWVLHKIRPQWVPVIEPGFINPPMVWVLKE